MLSALGELRDSLKRHLFWSKARIDCMTTMLLGLFSAGTVNLRKIAACSTGEAQKEGVIARFEDTHITYPERMTKLTALLAVGFVWVHQIGTKCFKDGSQRPQCFFLRLGFDFLQDALRPFQSMTQQFRECRSGTGGSMPLSSLASRGTV